MKAILVNNDRTLRWDDVPDPILGERDVLIEIHYAALNRADLMQRAGDYPTSSLVSAWGTKRRTLSQTLVKCLASVPPRIR